MALVRGAAGVALASSGAGIISTKASFIVTTISFKVVAQYLYALADTCLWLEQVPACKPFSESVAVSRRVLG